MLFKAHRARMSEAGTSLPFPIEGAPSDSTLGDATTAPKPKQQKQTSKGLLEHLRLRTASTSRKDGKSSSCPGTPVSQQAWPVLSRADPELVPLHRNE